MKNTAYITLITFIASLSACDNADMPIQHADSYDYITFSAQTEKIITRTNDYEAYAPTRHPTTMGAFGYYDIANYEALTPTRATSTTLPNPVFDNEVVTYSTANATWSTTSQKRWDDYKSAKTFDFFAYMPQTVGATVTRTATNTYMLSVPFTMPTNEKILFDTKQAPIICALPEHKEGTSAEGDQFTFERIIKMQFDQTLTGFKLLFKIDAKMNAIRHFRLKSVSLKGDIATAGTITRTYKWAGTEWTADNILWTDLQRTSFTDTGINIPYKASTDGNSSTDDNSQTMVVPVDEFKQWGTEFYMIPDTKFQPIITATYDVEFVSEDGSTIVTRKKVTSTITLNKNNFSSLASAKTAMIYPIRILIQPRYLYVLADEDAYMGHLLIE